MTFNIQSGELDRADDYQYRDFIVRSAFQEGRVWMLMIEPERIDRTYEVLLGLRQSLQHQLGETKRLQNGGDPEWRKRTLNLLAKADLYYTDLKAEMKRLDDEDREQGAIGQLERWKSIAGLLVDLLHDNAALKFIQIPAGAEGAITAAEWAAYRRQKSDERRAAAELEVEVAA